MLSIAEANPFPISTSAQFYMTALIDEVQSTLLSLLGRTIEILPGLLAGLVILLVTRSVAKFVRRVTSRVAKRTVKSRSLQTLMVQVCFVGSWTIGILAGAVLAFPGLELSSIVALLGLSSVAIGFAFQDIFKNFLAGVLLLIQEPFSIGDQIIVDGFEGTVKGIALRSTELQTYQGESVVLPNSIVFTSPVQVLTAMPKRRTDLAIGVDYNTPLSEAIEILRRAVSSVKGVLEVPGCEVDAVAFGDSSIDLLVRYWTHSEKQQVRKTQTRAMLALKQACDRENINIPYPIRSLYFYDQNSLNDSKSMGPKQSSTLMNGSSSDKNGHPMSNPSSP